MPLLICTGLGTVSICVQLCTQSLWPTTQTFISLRCIGIFNAGLSEWEDDRVLAAVLAASQQEYLQGLKQNSRGAESL